MSKSEAEALEGIESEEREEGVLSWGGVSGELESISGCELYAHKSRSWLLVDLFVDFIDRAYFELRCGFL